MKEININIEGYNVNGICVGCLNYNRKMFYDNDVKNCFKLIGNIDVPDGLTIQVCWECLAAVKKVIKFQNQILNSYDILIEYSQQHTFLDSPEDFTQHAATSLSTVYVPCMGTTGATDTCNIEFEIKDELKEESETNVAIEDNKSEKEEPENHEDSRFSEDFLSQDQDVQNTSSDEDIKLSTLRKKKPKKERKKKKLIKNDANKRPIVIDSESDEPDRPVSVSDEETDRSTPVETTKNDGTELLSDPLNFDFDNDGNMEKNALENVEETEKPSRKLKNLPSDIVELYTMSEQEMWAVRGQDVECEQFAKLRYKCTDCILGFNTEKLRDYHRNSKHKPKSANAYQCDVCKAYFLTKDNLTAHRSLHLSAYRCRQCALTTTMKRLMLRHHCAMTVSTEEYQCNDCDKLFSTKSKLNYHRNVSHQERPQCDCCGKVFANKMTLKYHLKILPHNKEEKPKEKLYIKCEGCNKVFHSKKSYRAHVVIHDGLSYPCPICGKLFQWKRNLSRHTRVHREKETGALHECRECGKTFSSRDCYNNHMRLSKRHASPNTYVHECNYCGKKFPTKWCMVDHIDWDHLKRVKYQCSVCFKPFKTAKIMVAHMNNIHEGKKREAEGEHLCDICGKSYKTVKRLKGHVWAMHTQRSNTKSYKCKLCAATFLWQTSIYKHVRMMHDNARTKPARAVSTVKKQDPYPDLELANRMYFHQNVTNMSQGVPPHPTPANGL